MQSFKEENYLKAIYQLKIGDQKEVVTITDIAVQLGLKTPTVLEKIKSMAIKKLISYDKISGVQLTKNGFDVAVNIVRRHRIWETYLYKELKFSWSEVHEIAEQLEHVNSAKLIEKIYAILGYPKFDPHGDPIPDLKGVLPKSERRPLSKSVEGCKLLILGVSEHSDSFLNYLSEKHIGLNDRFVIEKIDGFDESLMLISKSKERCLVSAKAAKFIQVACLKENCACKASGGTTKA
ncbi:MAG: metal-dependent transcriptional regulator [Bacteroidetes bacterium]|jgi:DtxR family Mn-dependent transcriptional regulator|nr:metal-dependent transcriptional regulator [Bacteroidota bacterium]MCA6443685.1 metal-dependent transcriptional regulator [Bacteroidota bacterium]